MRNGAAQLVETVQAEYMLVTPELATEWLNNHTNFRSVNSRRVELLAHDMASGNWHTNGESIKLKLDGTLFDGQHRLAAIVKANRPILTLVTWTDDTLGVDRGMGRTFGQLLTSKGYGFAAITQATARILHHIGKHSEVPESLGLISDDELMDFFLSLDYPLLQTCMRWGHNANVLKVCPSAASYAAMLYVFSGIDAERAEAFHNGVFTGENLPADSPILVLRNRFQWIVSTVKRGGGRTSARIVTALLIKAWNAYVEGRSIRMLKFLDTETYPEISTGTR